MSIAARAVGAAALVALLFYAAVGYSGFLVNDSFCTPMAEGSWATSSRQWTPPGMRCIFGGPSGADTSDVFADAVGPREHGRTGSWAAFAGALLLGFGVFGATLRRWPVVPSWLRLTAVTTLALAVGGAIVGYIGGDWQFLFVTSFYLGIPVAFAADHWLRPGARPEHAGFLGAAVAFCGVAIAHLGWLLGYGVGAYGAAILLVAAVTALPWQCALLLVADRT
ncbi:hypothetical protein [Solirubrobacter soli]|uniref:hypothetical protein n=1 Tax=Solirubrobacter soli TaxID=363832 RepID=UPI0003F4B89F|nr:hypothetical protein [Solirubrobacter soli]